MQKRARSNVISINRKKEQEGAKVKRDFYMVFLVISTIMAVLIAAALR